MCLGIPAKVVEVKRFEGLGLVEGKVDFSGVLKEINLSFTPEVEEGDYVVVHVGFAISIVDEEEALTTLRYLRELGELEAPGESPLA
jgi:hydrogenase expression/formation protein HypC